MQKDIKKPTSCGKSISIRPQLVKKNCQAVVKLLIQRCQYFLSKLQEHFKSIFTLCKIVIFCTFAFAGCFSSFGILFLISVLSNKIYIKVIVCVHLRVDDINILEAEEQYLS